MITPRDEYFHEWNDDPDPTAFAWFAHFEWTFDGLREQGEEQEWLPINQRRRFVREGRRG